MGSIARTARLVSFEARKLLARKLAVASFFIVAAVAAIAPIAGRVIDTAGALSKGQTADPNPFKNGWTTLAGGISAALPIAVVVVLVFAGSAIAEEAQLGTLKSLLARPVRRAELVLAKAITMFLFAFTLILLMSAASSAVAWANYGLGNVVDPEHNEYVFRTAATMMRFTLGSISLLLPSMLAVVAWALLWSAVMDHPGYAVGGSIGGLLVLALISGLSRTAGRVLFVTYVGRPISILSEIGEAYSGPETEFWRDLVPTIVIPLISAALFFTLSAIRVGRRDIGE